MGKVFVSYSRAQEDSGVAAELERYLTAHGLSVFRDSKIGIGDDWASTIDLHLRDSQFFVVLLSRAAAASHFVREEVRRARANGLRILPVAIEQPGELPFELGAYVSDRQVRDLASHSLAAICEEILSVVRGVDGLTPDGAHADELPPPETGTVSLDSPFYVRRDIDGRIESMLRRSGMTILLRGPRQVGKSSLLVRTEATARNFGQRVVRIDFQMVDHEHRRDLKSLLSHVAYVMAVEFQSTVQPDDVWDDRLGSKKSLTRFVERGVLKQAGTPVVLCLDEVDVAFTMPYCTDFFGMLRFWHNERATNAAWKKLHLVITHCTDPALWIADLDMSPFNVGERYHLTDFSAAEVRDLVLRHHLDTDVGALMRLVGGHPYLVRSALYSLKMSAGELRHLGDPVAMEHGPFGDHLQHLLKFVTKNEELHHAFRTVLDHGRCPTERAFQRLFGAGLIAGESREAAVPRCELYRQYFSKHL
jgi:AAA domain-containing protein/TIR domain-containing protein